MTINIFVKQSIPSTYCIIPLFPYHQLSFYTNPANRMSNPNSQYPLPFNNQQSQEPEQQQLLLQRQPEEELIDFAEIGGFLRDKNQNEDLANYDGLDHNAMDGLNDEKPDIHFQDHHNNHDLYHNHNDHNTNNNREYNHLQHSHPISQQNKPRRKCICKKTQCLKMYCQCFASNLPCNEECVCVSCKNTLEHHNEIIQAKKMIKQKGVVGLHSCSLSEKRCNCKKSFCLKKYCQCYNSGVKCSQACKCIDCKNIQPKQGQENHQEEEQKVEEKVRGNSKPKKPRAKKNAVSN